MNLFLTLLLAAQGKASWFARKHVPKMALEALQLLYTAHWIADEPWTRGEGNTLPPSKPNGERGYKAYNPGMLLSQWVASCPEAYFMVIECARLVLEEYTTRTGKVSPMETHVEWLAENPPALGRGPLEPMPCYVVPKHIVLAETWDQVHRLYAAYFRTHKRRMMDDLVESLSPEGLVQWLEEDALPHTSPRHLPATAVATALGLDVVKSTKIRKRYDGVPVTQSPAKRRKLLVNAL